MQTIWLSPTDYVTGDPTLQISYPSVTHPNTLVTCAAPGDLKWISMSLRLPENVSIEEVIICYQLSHPLSFISQVRLDEMSTPDHALVIHDDGTDLQSLAPTCYSSTVGGKVPTPGTAVTLSLRLNFGTTTDQILLGAVGVKIQPAAELCANVCKAAARLAPTGNHGLNGLADIDGVTPEQGDRILVTQQTTQSQNGLYVADSGTWTRPEDADGTIELPYGFIVSVAEGSVHGGSLWRHETAGAITLGSTALVFRMLAPGPGSMALTADATQMITVAQGRRRLISPSLLTADTTITLGAIGALRGDEISIVSENTTEFQASFVAAGATLLVLAGVGRAVFRFDGTTWTLSSVSQTHAAPIVDIRDWGAKDDDSDNTSIFTEIRKYLLRRGGGTMLVPKGHWRGQINWAITNPADLGKPLVLLGEGDASTVYYASGVVFDCSSNSRVVAKNIRIHADAGADLCVLQCRLITPNLAPDKDPLRGAGAYHRFERVTLTGTPSLAGLYNVGCEVSEYEGCDFRSLAPVKVEAQPGGVKVSYGSAPCVYVAGTTADLPYTSPPNPVLSPASNIIVRFSNCRFVKDVAAGFLFSVGLGFQSDLEQGSLSEGFRQAFEDHGISLSGNVTITTEMESNKWQINDADHGQTYTVIRRDETLNIYATGMSDAGPAVLVGSQVALLTFDSCYFHTSEIPRDPTTEKPIPPELVSPDMVQSQIRVMASAGEVNQLAVRRCDFESKNNGYGSHGIRCDSNAQLKSWSIEENFFYQQRPANGYHCIYLPNATLLNPYIRGNKVSKGGGCKVKQIEGGSVEWASGSVVLTGPVSIGATQISINSSSEVKVDDWIYVGRYSSTTGETPELRQVASIASDTQLTVTSAFLQEHPPTFVRFGRIEVETADACQLEFNVPPLVPPLVPTADRGTTYVERGSLLSGEWRPPRLGVGVAARAHVHVKAGSAVAGHAPLKLTSGPLLTVPETGAVEYVNDSLYFTPSAARERLFTGPLRVTTNIAPGTISPASIWESADIAVPGAAANDSVLIGPPTEITQNIVWSAYVWSAGNLRLRIANPQADASVVVAPADWQFTVLH